jgi:hypothetical protein
VYIKSYLAPDRSIRLEDVMQWFYLGLAITLAVVVLAIGARLVFPRREASADEPLPWTALQKRSCIALALGVVGMVTLVAVFAVRGLDSYDRDASTRVAVYLLMLLGMGTGLAIMPRSIRGARRPWVDERDLRILERAPAFQGVAVIAVLAVWMIGLTEAFHDAGAIPVVFPSLIFFSAVYVHVVALALGILIGYRRGIEDA